MSVQISSNGIETSYEVRGVDRSGASVEVNGTPARLSWGELRAAAAQEDTGLRSIYSAILRDALSRAAAGPLRVDVVPCASGVGHRVRVTDAAGVEHRDVMRADEGGDHHGGGLGVHGRPFADAEAAEITARLAASHRL